MANINGTNGSLEEIWEVSLTLANVSNEFTISGKLRFPNGYESRLAKTIENCPERSEIFRRVGPAPGRNHQLELVIEYAHDEPLEAPGRIDYGLNAIVLNPDSRAEFDSKGIQLSTPLKFIRGTAISPSKKEYAIAGSYFIKLLSQYIINIDSVGIKASRADQPKPKLLGLF